MLTFESLYMNHPLKVALIYKQDYVFLSGNHFDNTTYDFFMKALKRNKKLKVTYFPCKQNFDTSILKNEFDVILLPNNNTDGSPDNLIGIDKIKIPVICRTGDPHWAKKYNQFRFHEKYKIDYYFNFMHESYFYKFYPKHFKYKTIIFGLEPKSYKKIKPFNERVSDKILNSGAIGKNKLISKIVNAILNPKRSGWYFYKLRTLCNELPYVQHFGIIGKKYANEDYPSLLARYKGAIAATTYYPTIKYLETSAAGCLTFMEITDLNKGNYLGFKDQESAIFINEKNYKKKLKEFISDPNNPKWERIANEGRKHTIMNLNNDTAVESLVELIEKLIKY